jgi:hypothetical protein
MMQQLKTQHHRTAPLDARLLLEHASGLSSTDLAMQAKQEADATLIHDAQALVASAPDRHAGRQNYRP